MSGTAGKEYLLVVSLSEEDDPIANGPEVLAALTMAATRLERFLAGRGVVVVKEVEA